MGGAYTAKPAAAAAAIPPGWSPLWPFPGPWPPGYVPVLAFVMTAPESITIDSPTAATTLKLTDHEDYPTTDPALYVE